MDFKRIFAEAERCHLEGKSASFNESFLNFASYAEGDQSICPYWRVLNELEKFFFIDECFSNEIYSEEREYILDHKKEFWIYLNNNTEFSCLNFSSNIHYYMSSFSIYSMLLLSNRNIIPRDYSASEFVLTLSKCEEAKIYFNYLLHKLIILTRGCGSMNFPLFYAEVKERDLPVIQAAIIDKIDKLIGRG